MRKVKYLVAALLLMGATTTFTSCIDNDEPAGITELRGAKAELLKAKAAVELANAAYVEAQTQYELAMVEQLNLTNEGIKLANELQQAKNEEEIANINNRIEQNKLIQQKILLTLQQELAEAQKKYDDAMAALELSKEFLSDDVLAILEKVQENYNNAYIALYGGEIVETDDAGVVVGKETIKGAQEELKDAYIKYEKTVIDANNYVNEATLKNVLATATADRDAVKAELELKEEALSILLASDEYTAWKNLQQVYNAKKDSLEIVKGDKENQIEKIISENVSVITAAKKAETKVNDTEEAAVATETSSVTIESGNYAPQIGFKNGEYVTFAEGKFTANFKAKVLALTINEGDDKNPASETEKQKERDYKYLLDDKAEFDVNKGYKAFSEEIDKAVKAIQKAKEEVTSNDIANDAANLPGLKKDMETAKEAADKAVDVWEDAVAAYTAEPGGGYSDTEYAEDWVEAQSYLVSIKGASKADDPVVLVLYSKFMEIWNKWIEYGYETKADYSDAKKLYDAVTAVSTVDDLLPTEIISFSNEANLLKASKEAFGIEKIDGKYVLVQPSDEDIREAGAGAYFYYLDKKDKYEATLANTEVVATYDKAIEQVTAWKTVLSTARATYLEDNKEVIDGVSSALKNLTDKVVTPIAKVNLDQTKDALKIVGDVLKYGIEVEDENGVVKIRNLDKLVDELKLAIGKPSAGTNDGGEFEVTYPESGLYNKLEIAEEQVLRAEKMLELYKAGSLNEQYIIEWAENELNVAKANYESAVNEFNYWSKKLAEITNKLYDTAGESAE